MNLLLPLTRFDLNSKRDILIEVGSRAAEEAAAAPFKPGIKTIK